MESVEYEKENARVHHRPPRPPLTASSPEPIIMAPGQMRGWVGLGRSVDLLYSTGQVCVLLLPFTVLLLDGEHGVRSTMSI